MSKLLPCPFCGGEAEIERYTIKPYVSCTKCGCSMPDRHQTAEQAIEVWNSRAERTCKQEERGWGTEGDHARVWLTCGHDCMVPTVQDLPNYCPNCGAKVIGG